MTRFVFSLATLFSLLLHTVAHAQSPNQFELTYRFTLNGQYLGNVTDTFTRNGDNYQLTSVARPDGALSMLLPTLTLNSEGELKQHQFIPAHFSQTRGSAVNNVSSDFDWQQGVLTHHYKGKSKQIPLKPGVLDVLVQLYSFTLMDILPDTLELPVSNGRKLMTYHYKKQPAVRIEAALGQFDAYEYRRIADASENAISVWVAPGLNNLPLRIRVREKTGVFEQQLVNISFK